MRLKKVSNRMSGNYIIKTLTNKLYKTNLDCQFAPLESTLSLPIPIQNNRHTFIAFLYFTANKDKKDEKIKIFKPNARITFELSTAKIIHYQNYHFIDSFNHVNWNEPIGEFPHSEIESMSLAAYKREKEELIKKYDRVIELFKINSVENPLRLEFKKLFIKLCEPCLIEYMKHISRDFFAWLDHK